MAVWTQICQAHEVFLEVCFWKYIPCIMGWKITKLGDWKNNCFSCRYRPSIRNSLLAFRPIPATMANLEGSVFSQMVHGELYHILWIIITPLCAAQTIVLQKNLLRRAPTKCNFFKLIASHKIFFMKNSLCTLPKLNIKTLRSLIFTHKSINQRLFIRLVFKSRPPPKKDPRYPRYRYSKSSQNTLCVSPKA